MIGTLANLKIDVPIKMPKIAKILTDREIKSVKTAAKPYCLFDGQVTGLHLLIQPSGAKLWRLRFTFDKKEKRMALGQYPITTLSDARESATNLLRQIKKGIDPTILIVPVKKITFGEVTRNYIENSRLRKRKSEQRISYFYRKIVAQSRLFNSHR